MATFTDFTPVPRSAFQFQPTLDGQVYKVQVRWNVFGQRWYVFVYTLQSVLVTCVPLTGSPDPMVVASMVWDGTRKIVTVTTAAPHGIRLGTVVDLTVSEALPDTFNGTFRLTVVSPTNLTYAQPDDPSAVTLPGVIGRDIDLTAGYFDTSVMVYRASSKQFEVSP